jgi:hypothetical protein
MYDHDFDDCSRDGLNDAADKRRYARMVGKSRAWQTRYSIRAWNAHRYYFAYGVRRYLD